MKAVVSGSRSGKIVFEFYDQLVSLWGGSANIEPLTFGMKGDDFNETEKTLLSVDQDLSGEVEADNNSDVVDKIYNTKKRKSCIPQLIDNKRKHLERNLSAAQQDQILFKEARDDAQFGKEMTEAMRESTESINTVSNSMTDLGNSISHSIELLAQAMLIQTKQSSNQNQFYQNLLNIYTQTQLNPLVLPTNTSLKKTTEENIKEK